GLLNRSSDDEKEPRMKRSRLLGLMLLFGCTNTTPVEQSQETATTGDALGAIDPPSVEYSGNEIILELPGFRRSKQLIDSKEYTRIEVPGHSELDKAGYPALPKVRINVPVQGTPSLQVVDTIYTDIKISDPVPSR